MALLGIWPMKRPIWTKDTALSELEALVAEGKRIEQHQAFDEAHTRWIARVLAVLEEVFGPQSRYYLSFADLPWRQTGSFIVGGLADREGSYNPQRAVERKHHQAYLEQLGTPVASCWLLRITSEDQTLSPSMTAKTLPRSRARSSGCLTWRVRRFGRSLERNPRRKRTYRMPLKVSW